MTHTEWMDADSWQQIMDGISSAPRKKQKSRTVKPDYQDVSVWDLICITSTEGEPVNKMTDLQVSSAVRVTIKRPSWLYREFPLVGENFKTIGRLSK